MSEYIVAVIVCFACAIYVGIKSGRRQKDIKTVNDLVEKLNKLRFKNDELLMDKKLLKDQIKRIISRNSYLSRSNGQLRRNDK